MTVLQESDGLTKDGHSRAIQAISIVSPLAEANRALMTATIEAETANRAKSDFLSRMSHELRTPLNAILGFAQILRMRDLGERDNRGLDYILKAGRHLLALIDEVLDIARIEVGRLALSLEPVDLGLSVREVLQLTAPLAAQQAIELVNEVNETLTLHVRADKQRLTQVLLNLVSNAIKYNRVGGRVMLRCTTQENGWLRLLVQDTGAGIAHEHLVKVFQPFERLGAAHSAVEGTGMGLALCKRLVELMGGTIGVESVVGEGSTFWFALLPADSPINPGPASQGPSTPSPAPGLSRRGTVLYVEDNASNLTLIQHLLAEMADVRLLTAMQGRLGLELAHGQSPDLILLDLHLPDITGEEVLRRLRADSRTCAIPVAILSADALPSTIERLRDAGAAAYLTKPIDVRQLLNFLHDILAPERSCRHGP
jgi:CheY-like chemotaxis protein/nitrogen-specific signal transduction histidine kinase